MALTVTVLDSIHDNVDRSSYQFASKTFVNDRLYLVFVTTTHGSLTPPGASSITGSGTGLNFTKHGSSLIYGSGLCKAEVWRAQVSSGAGTGTLVMPLSGNTPGTSCNAVLVEITGHKGTGANGLDAIVQMVTNTATATSLTVNLSSFASPNNRPLSYIGHRAPEVINPGTGYTELDDGGHPSPSMGVQLQWHSSSADTSPNASWSTSAGAGGIALELAIAGTDGSATGDVPEITTTKVQGSASGTASATGAVAEITTTKVQGSASGTASATGAVAEITLSPVLGTASTVSGAVGSIPPITLDLVLGTATGLNTAFGSIPPVTLSPITASATGTTAGDAQASGLLSPITFDLVLGTADAEHTEYKKTIISQYANSPTLNRLLYNFNQYMNPAADLDGFYNAIWNIETATDYGLDVWGKIVGVNRYLKVDEDLDYLGFDEAGSWQPFGQAPFYAGNIQGSFRLSNDAFRTLIMVKALANISSTTVPALNRLIQNLFKGRGRCYVNDQGSMVMRYTFEFLLKPYEKAILVQSGVLPNPTGVKSTLLQVTPPLLGFAEANDPDYEGFGTGIWYSDKVVLASVDTTPPAIPANLVVIVLSQNSIRITWDAVIDAEPVQYRIFRNGISIGTTSGTTFDDTGLSAATTYTYAVASFDTNGNNSEPSTPVSGTTDAPVIDTTIPTAPTDLTLTVVSSSRIDMTWTPSTDNVGVIGYRVFRGATLVATRFSTDFSDTGLSASTNYTYTVDAFDLAGNFSDPSASQNATTSSATDTQKPTIPATLTATALSSSQIMLSWPASTDNVGVTGYKIYRGQAASSTTVGFVGASISMNAINGAHTVGSSRFWYPVPQFGGGGLWKWAQNLTNSNAFWADFDAAYQAQPSNIIWWQLAAVATDKANETYTNAVKVFNEIKRRIPNATVYVSAQPFYTPSTHVCTIAGSDGPARMAALVDQLVANGVCLLGPVMGPLNASTQILPNDSCHANTDGENMEGQQLIDFFQNIPATTRTQVGTSTTTTHTDSGLAASTSYTYTVSAVDAAGNESDQSVVATATTASTTGFNNRPVGLYSLDSPVDLPFVDGMLYRTGWKTFETSQGVYNFSSIESKIAALPANQKLTLAIFAIAGARNDVPSYVITGAGTETWTDTQNGKNPLPWNAYALSRWDALCEALANHVYQGVALKDHPKLAQIDCSIIGTQGIRLRDPLSVPGYTAQKYKDACIAAVTSMASRFPAKNCYVGLFGIGGQTYPAGTAEAQAIRDALLATFDGVSRNRINFFQETWTGIAPEVGSPQGNLVYDVRTKTSIMLQACWSWMRASSGTQCTWVRNAQNAIIDTPQMGVDNAAQFGSACTYFEIYNDDLQNSAYQSTWQALHASLPAH